MPGGIQREIPTKWSLEGGTPLSPHRPAPLPSPSQGPVLQGVGGLVLKKAAGGSSRKGSASSRGHHGSAAVPLGKAGAPGSLTYRCWDPGLGTPQLVSGDLLENIHLLHPGQQKLLGEAVLGPFFQLRWIT
ncbi:uncharacterized protein [Macaca fascicularis]|uniref:Unnamed protein product n=1 Tax=Macaca fascicularis TaxID=9541 RepID=Q9N070_MACFA|nr:unnamed protein product [Macaca fascicularis]